LMPVIGWLSLLVMAGGCATVQDTPDLTWRTDRKGVTHKVKKGQTLWRIAQAYGIGMDEIIVGNNIPDAAVIEEDQLLFIPGADEIVDLPPLVPEAGQREFIWPVNGRVASYFGDRRGLQRRQGIELATLGRQPVRAARRGKVVFADYLTGYNYTVILDHQDGYFSVYGKNGRLLVEVGDIVAQGDQIARTEPGDEGTFYFEIRKGTVAENPLYFLPRR